MRCKIGDLAIIVNVESPFLTPNIGVWVKVEEPAPDKGHGPAWFVRTMQQAMAGDGSIVAPGSLARCEDYCLQPIRPPKPPEALPAPSVELEKETT